MSVMFYLCRDHKELLVYFRRAPDSCDWHYIFSAQPETIGQIEYHTSRYQSLTHDTFVIYRTGVLV